MVVDDTPANLKLLDDMLRVQGYRVVTFPRGNLALKAIAESPPDLILLDVMMPQMDGFTACRLIKSNPDWHDIPVVMVTALNAVGDRVKALEAGADDFLNTPVDHFELLARVKSSLEIKRLRNREKVYLKQILEEKAKIDELLHTVMPASIVARLKAGEAVIADDYALATVLLMDIVDFTLLSSKFPSAELVQLLSRIFNRFDDLVERHGLEKIKTTGDAYMVAGGLTVHREDHAEAVADFALDAVREIASFQSPDGTPVCIRTGVSTGPVTAGVIGKKRLIYDVWGDAVNIASRMESHGEPGKIHISETTALLLEQKYLCERRGHVEIKGKGLMDTYFLIQKRRVFA
jgi:class 3 adenylate cyclase